MPETNGLTYPFAEHPKEGTLRQVADSVYWLKMPFEGGLDHINLYLLEDSDGWFVVDTGWKDEPTEKLWREIFDKRLSGKPVKGVICTHFHPGHTGQAEMIVDTFRCSLHMTFKEYYQAVALTSNAGRHSGWQPEEFHLRAGLDPEFSSQMRAGLRRGNPFSRQSMPTALLRLEHGQILIIGGHDWRVVLGSGHSPEHACIHCASLSVLISGDQILPGFGLRVSPESGPQGKRFLTNSESRRQMSDQAQALLGGADRLCRAHFVAVLSTSSHTQSSGVIVEGTVDHCTDRRACPCVRHRWRLVRVEGPLDDACDLARSRMAPGPLGRLRLVRGLYSSCRS